MSDSLHELIVKVCKRLGIKKLTIPEIEAAHEMLVLEEVPENLSEEQLENLYENYLRQEYLVNKFKGSNARIGM
jgi:hypothetical protein